ncbi:TPA: hypothetical protein QH850_001083 [Enterobacter chengduensis]|nr:hypothetical protein [Enterobacter chengduensis]
MKFKKGIISSLFFAGQINNVSAALMRDDISVQVYRDYAENRGVFTPGAINVPVYHIDGSISGTLNLIPDFSSNADGGFSTLISAQVAPSATHVSYTNNLTFGKRFQQLDSTLFSGAENESSYTLMNEVTKRAYDIEATDDYKITRLRTIVTDAAPSELFTDTSQIKNGLLIARVGGGNLTIALDKDNTQILDYGPLAGGTNIIEKVDLNGQVYKLTLTLREAQKTALDVGTQGGDSGSGVWGWDTKSQSWKLVAINSAGGGTKGYGKKSYLKAAPQWTLDTMESFNDAAINTIKSTDIIYAGAQDRVSGEGNLTLNGNDITYHGIRTDIAATALVDNDFKSNKNLIFGGAGGTIQLTGKNLDLGTGSITFNSDYILSNDGDDSRRLNSAGYIINAGAVVTSLLTGGAGDIWRKVGVGTLIIAGNRDNQASLNVGDGLTILQRLGGSALKTLHIGSGRATVRLGAADQLDGTQVGFGTRGGILDLYGQSLSWKDIIHMDNGATLTSSKSGAQSTFTFVGSGPKTYLGNFIDGGSLSNGLLHLVYAPTTKDSSWTLKGNINTRGGMDIISGYLAIQGAQTLHAGGYIDPTQYEKASFDMGESQVNLRDASFTVGRNATARGDFFLDDKSTLIIESGGETSSDSQGVLEGAYLDGSVNLTTKNSTLRVTPEDKFRVQINANLTGQGRIIKEGAGTLFITGINALTGNNLISRGRVIVNTLASLGTQQSGWTISNEGILDVGNNTSSIATLLDKISDASQGVLALSGAIVSAADIVSLRDELYIGSSDYLSLGAVGTNLTTAADKLYLGGGDGEVGIKGHLTQGSTLFLGNGESNGIVRIESHNANWVGNIDLKRGINLIGDFDDSLGNGSLNLGYGATTSSKFLANMTLDSAGMINIDPALRFGYDLSNFKQLALGALAGNTLLIDQPLIASQTGYYFSGAGDVVINSALDKNKNLNIDAQDNQGGTITLNRANDLEGLVTVRGYNSGNVVSAKSDMTLKIGVDEAVGSKARVVLEDGGVIDLNGYTNSLDIEKSSKLSKITSSQTLRDSILNLLVNSDTTLNSLISGANIHINKVGLGTLTLSGENLFSGSTLLSAGKTILSNGLGFGLKTNTVTIGKNAELDLYGQTLENTIILDSGTLLTSKPGAISLGTLKVKSDSFMHFNNSTDKITIGTYELNGNRLTIDNINTTFGKKTFDNGDIIFNKSNISWTNNNSIFTNSTGSVTVGKGTTLELRDVNQTAGASKTLILDGGTIASGTNGNGGGLGAKLRSGINVETNGTLVGNNKAFGILLGIYGQLTGDGKLSIAGEKGVGFYGDTSGFTGDLILKSKSIAYLAPEQDTSLAGNISSEGTGKVVKQGAGSLSFSGNNQRYLNELEIKEGNLTFSTAQSVMGGKIKLTGGRMTFASDEDQILNNIISGTTGSIVKQGAGSTVLNAVNTFNQKTVVEEGVLVVGDARNTSAQLAGSVEVNPLGTLQGYGTVRGNISNSGLVRPAGAGKSFSVKGQYSQTADATFFIDIDPVLGASKMAVKGVAELAGHFKSLFAPGTYTEQTYEILTAAGGIRGVFSDNLQMGNDTMSQSLNYAANNLTLTTVAKSVDPVTPPDPIAPVTPADPITPADPVAPVTPIDPIVPADPVAPVTPIDPIVPADPEAPATPVDPIVPADPITPVTPVAPIAPADPVAPVTPVDPIVPADPVAPVTPVDPIVPADPITPVTPVDPIVPADPAAPVTPVDPVAPADPITPVTPVDPIVPADPAAPVTPVDPVAPVTPTNPITPIAPVVPVTPADPDAPARRFTVRPANIGSFSTQLLSIGMQKPIVQSMQQVNWAQEPFTQSACNVAGRCFSNNEMWIVPHAGGGSGGSNNLSARLKGITIGGFQENHNTRLGMSIDYSDYNQSINGSSSSAQRYAVNIFASQRMTDLVLTGSLGYTHSPIDVKRQVTSSGIYLGDAKSGLSADAVSASFTADWPMALRGATITPQIGIDSLNVFYSGFVENISAKDEIFGSVIEKMKVRGDATRYFSVQPKIGINVIKDFTIAGMEVTPNLNLSYRKELINGNNNRIYSMDGTRFDVPGDSLGLNIVEYSAGLNIKITQNLTSSFSYTSSHQQGYRSQEGAIKMTYNF